MADEANGSAAGWVLPEKWSDDLVDEKGEKLSKRYVWYRPIHDDCWMVFSCHVRPPILITCYI